MSDDRHAYEPKRGDRVRARRYEQPTLIPGDPRRVLTGEWTGTVNAHHGMLTDDGPARSTYLSFGYVFLGGRPEDGTAAYAVTEVEPERVPERQSREAPKRGRTR
jgi:hypothetical protein